MSYVGAWCPDELVGAIEEWLKREKKKRRVNRTDFLLEAAKEKLIAEKIEISEGGSSAFRSGQKRKIVYPQHRLTAAEMNDKSNSTVAAVGKVLGEQAVASVRNPGVVYRRSRKVASTSGKTSSPASRAGEHPKGRP